MRSVSLTSIKRRKQDERVRRLKSHDRGVFLILLVKTSCLDAAGKHVGAKVIKANSSTTDQSFQESNSTNGIDFVSKRLLKSVYASFRLRNAFKSLDIFIKTLELKVRVKVLLFQLENRPRVKELSIRGNVA